MHVLRLCDIMIMHIAIAIRTRMHVHKLFVAKFILTHNHIANYVIKHPRLSFHVQNSYPYT